MSSFYVLTYKVYKFKFKIFESKAGYFIVMGIFTLFLFMISGFIYNLIIPIILTTIFIAFVYLLTRKMKNLKKKILIGVFLNLAVLTIFIFAIYFTQINPLLSEVNTDLSSKLRENVEIDNFLSSINETINNAIGTNINYNLTISDVCNFICSR